MRHLRAVTDLRVLGLDEGADLAVRTEHGARTQPRERADFGVRIDHRQLTVGADDVGVLAHLDVA